MDILSMVLIGFLVGSVSKMVVPGRGGQGWLATIVVGVMAALAVGLYTRRLGWFEADQTSGLASAMMGALVCVVGFRLMTRRRKVER